MSTVKPRPSPTGSTVGASPARRSSGTSWAYRHGHMDEPLRPWAHREPPGG
ncbi:hypothetical protein [Kitasatospora sp. NPDC001547]|uniref:hypothetical protein n=1 Tax=Kitasatospora sp. NPDC001547 TaxID=3364015 RepID=UPI0036B32A59